MGEIRRRLGSTAINRPHFFRLCMEDGLGTRDWRATPGEVDARGIMLDVDHEGLMQAHPMLLIHGCPVDLQNRAEQQTLHP